MRASFVILLLALAGPAVAGQPMSAGEFDAYTRGKTLFYGYQGTPYGAERYLEGRQVIWSFLDGVCRKGYWYEAEDGLICFIYEDRPDPQCWSFELEAGRLIARFENDAQATELYEAEELGEEMICLGPRVGV